MRYFQMAFEAGTPRSEPQADVGSEQRNLFDIAPVQLRRHLIDRAMPDRAADRTSYILSRTYLSLADCDAAIFQVWQGRWAARVTR